MQIIEFIIKADHTLQNKITIRVPKHAELLNVKLIKKEFRFYYSISEISQTCSFLEKKTFLLLYNNKKFNLFNLNSQGKNLKYINTFQIFDETFTVHLHEVISL